MGFLTLLIRIHAIEPAVGFYVRYDRSKGEITDSLEVDSIDDMLASLGDKSEFRIDSVDLDFLGHFLDFYNGYCDNEKRRWDKDNRCWDRINDGYEWDEDEEYWR